MTTMGAVIYLRVSTAEQADGPLNLPNQERRCRDFCTQHGLTPLQVFVDPGESARTADRPEFQRMLAYCRAHKREVSRAVVQDLSRFARNNADQAHFMAELQAMGVELCSVSEPNVNATAAGKLAANIHGTFNQYFSDFLSEKMCERSRAAVLAGRWPWSAPLGYLNVDCKDGANIVHDPPRAPLIHRAFEMVFTGSYTESDVLRTVTLEGLTTKSGKPLSKQTFHALLRNPVYAGWIVSRKTGLQSKGLHRPIVEQALFDAVQRILRGDKPNAAPRRKLNPEFPLRRFVLCAACNRPLTGGFSRSKTGKRHGYYHCCVCGQNVRKDRLETQFLELLKRLQPSEETVKAFPKIAADIWAEQQGDADGQAKCITAQLDKLKQKKSQLVRSLVGEEDPELQDAYRAEHRKISSEIAEAEAAIQEVALCRDEADSFIRFVELSLMDIAECWKQAGPEDRVGVQSLLFFGGLSYSPKTKSLNPANSTLFKMLDRIVSEKINLAPRVAPESSSDSQAVQG